jgi:hypothetical protein
VVAIWEAEELPLIGKIMWAAIIILVLVVGYLTYDHLPEILSHRERMAQIKKDKNNE